MNTQQYRPRGFRLLPPVVKNLLIINVIFFLATITFQNAFNIDLVNYLGLHYLAAEKFSPYQFITYMFMHGSIGHIFFNMFALWMFGNVLENVWGPKRFLIYYMVTGIGAAIVHYIVFYFEISPVLSAINNFTEDPSNAKLQAFLNSSNFRISTYEMQNHFNEFVRNYNSLINVNHERALQTAMDYISQYKIDFLNAPVVIGASGAVFGILLAFGMMFPNSLIYIYFAFPIKAKYFVIIYGIIELVSGFYDTGSNVAHFAHLGGMVFGFFLIIYWKKKLKLF
ncbi:MAG: rhomboid family intramembrane serine protease [Bacteroidetes bacterium]|nr:rhomboid family intramembrane serine protease [Bacteroidota bacterium]MCK4361137.1 rhomboid family intramembrane serine protease [Bacteroidales bacterium]MCK4407124.1 rhomboid family intramembrane serine protease [Bacteroidales bacterium]